MAELRLLFTSPVMTYRPSTGEYTHTYTWTDEDAHALYDKLAALTETIPSILIKQWEMIGRL